MDPALVLARCNLQSTDSVAEFGAGSGALARAAAALVPHGTVFAIDVHRDVVRRLAHDAADEGLRHLYALWGDIETHGGSMLADNSINLALLSNVLFHLDDRGAPFKEAHRVLVPEGKLLVVDWLRTINGVGPRPQALVSKESAIALADRAGFVVLNDKLPAGDHHYAILFKKATHT